MLLYSDITSKNPLNIKTVGNISRRKWSVLGGIRAGIQKQPFDFSVRTEFSQCQRPLLCTCSFFMLCILSTICAYFMIMLQGSVIPAIFWLGFPELGWQLVILMTVSLYVGNAMKDLVCAPRPLGLKFGRVKVSCLCSSEVETGKNAFEFGLPSSHTMNSICFNFYICHYFHQKGFFSDNMALVFYLLVTLWVSWIAISRIYLGLHTPIDILAGAVAGLTVLTAFISLRDLLVHSIFQPFSGLVTLLFSALLLRLHPKPIHHTPSFEFTTSFVGVSFGVVSALSIDTPLFETAASLWEHNYAMLYTTRRLLVGYLVVLFSKSISKAIFRFLLPFLYVTFPMPIRKLWQPPVHDRLSTTSRASSMPRTQDGSPADVDATARFLSYAGLGFGTCYIAPVVFQYCKW